MRQDRSPDKSMTSVRRHDTWYPEGISLRVSSLRGSLEMRSRQAKKIQDDAWVWAVAHLCAHPLEAGAKRDEARRREEKGVVGVASLLW